MDKFYYEIVTGPSASARVPEVRRLIEDHADLSFVAEPWEAPHAPSQRHLYAVVVLVSADLAEDDGACDVIARATSGGFPVIPVIESLASYDFSAAPLPEISDRNAVELDPPERLVQSLLHHAGVQLYEGGGHVFLSYARSDGSHVADCIRDALKAAGIGQTMDVYAFPGGELIQDEIAERIQKADLVIVVDTWGAARSPWVEEELDIARAERVPVLAVTAAHGGTHFRDQVPHVPFGAGEDLPARVVSAVRRLLARKVAFHTRVDRTLRRVARLGRWMVEPDAERWVLTSDDRAHVRVACSPDPPQVEDVGSLKRVLEQGRGLFVAGLRPLRRDTVRLLELASERQVTVAPLPTMATGLASRVAGAQLTGRRIFLAAAMPSHPDELELARETLAPLVVTLAQAIVALDATLVFGGHPSVTPLVHRAIAGDIGPGNVELHQARKWQTDQWTLSLEVREGPLFRDAQWHGNGVDAAADVAALRDGMIDDSLHAAVFVGGKTDGFIGPRPGIVDEYQRFRKARPDAPAFVLGLAGGAARNLPLDDRLLHRTVRDTADPDLAVALIVAELIRRGD